MALVSSALSLSDEVVLRLRRDGERGNFGPAPAPSARVCERVRAGAPPSRPHVRIRSQSSWSSADR